MMTSSQPKVINSLVLLLAVSLATLIEDYKPLTRVYCNRVHSILYNKQNGIDYYYANPNQVTTNLKSILPAQLLVQQQAELQSAGSLDALPQVTSSFGSPIGIQRGRSAKQLDGFDSEVLQMQQPSAEVAKSAPVAAEAPASAIHQQQQQNVCLTPGCVKAAAEILKNMDERVNPCDDFYKYSCGNWIDSQIIPEDKTSVSLFSVVQDELDNKLRNLIEKPPASEGDSPPIVEKMRNLYESCMNTSKYHLSDVSSYRKGSSSTRWW